MNNSQHRYHDLGPWVDGPAELSLHPDTLPVHETFVEMLTTPLARRHALSS